MAVSERIDLSSHVYVSQRLRLHYVDWGNRKAPPLILVHGGRDHCRNWDWVASDLSRDYHVITPDLRGHGDSEWTSDGQYPMSCFVYDLVQLVEQQELGPVTLVGHSLGGSICLRYAGLYPEMVRKLVAIEGLGFMPDSKPPALDVRMREWIDRQRSLARHQRRRYDSIDDAIARMRSANPHLTSEQARHLTVHGANRNEDGTYSWKFDNYFRAHLPTDDGMDLPHLWSRIISPVMLAWGTESWASNPAEDGRSAFFRDVRVSIFEGAGHWLHHDRLDDFLTELRSFLDAEV